MRCSLSSQQEEEARLREKEAEFERFAKLKLEEAHKRGCPTVNPIEKVRAHNAAGVLSFGSPKLGSSGAGVCGAMLLCPLFYPDRPCIVFESVCLVVVAAGFILW